MDEQLVTLGGIIGIGFFTNAGEVLSVAGPGGTVLAFFVVGLVAFCVLEGITEMIVLWPVPNAMVEYVRTFVDEDLGIVIGLGYCYTYTVTFSSLMVSVANLADYWTITSGLKSTIFIIGPILLMIFNLLPVDVFGWIEGIGGIIKLVLVGFVFVLMILVNQGVVGNNDIGTKYWSQFVEYNPNIANSKAEAMFIAIPKVAFAYIGVELLTTTAYEARSSSDLKWTAMTIVPLVCVMYVAIVASFVANVGWDDPRLPQIFGQTSNQDTDHPGKTLALRTDDTHVSTALPVIALIEAQSPALATVVTIALMYCGLSAANTALYVASRTIYGFARNIDIPRDASRLRRFCARISDVLPTTGAPLFAVMLPVGVLYWLPFVHIEEDET